MAVTNTSMRVFGIPFQFTSQADPRYSSVNESVGHTFLENIILEEPIITIIPGRPRYTLDKDKTTFTQALLSDSDAAFEPLKALIKGSSESEIRYYDFQRAYTEYMQYVNVLCRACASFLGLTDSSYSPDGTTPLTRYDWRNYRQDRDSYTNVASSIISAAGDAIGDAIVATYTAVTDGDTEQTYYKFIDNDWTAENITSLSTESTTITDETTEEESVEVDTSEAVPTDGSTETSSSSEEASSSESSESSEESSEEETDDDTVEISEEDSEEEEPTMGLDEMVSAMSGAMDNDSSSIKYGTYNGDDDTATAEEMDTTESLLKEISFVQFFVDASSLRSGSESYGNDTTESKIKQAFESVQDNIKEIAFIMNSGGLSTDIMESVGEFVTSTGEGLGSIISGVVSPSAGTFISRALNLAGNVIKGENVVMPEIYNKSSKTSGDLSFTVKLRAVYGNTYCYFMECLVPLMHLLALGLPKQTTANTYGSPFIVKAYVAGCQTVNLGMVESIEVSRGSDDGTWTADGLPNEIDVTVSIKELYSDLSMSPGNSPLLFINNSSLIEYLATVCGLDLSQPQPTAKLSNIINTTTNAVLDVPTTVYSGATEAISSLITGWMKI